ncbi:MAG: winged helix-turn-helix transcriptional regulator [Thermoplasmata archaeon]|nr:winged helix-turn-helix transcriptional regulator [Thermoplasmata archaeon]
MEDLKKKGFAKVLEALESGDKRYTEVSHQVHLSSATLSKRLREARTAGLVQAKASEEGPKPVIVYALSRKGRKVIEALKNLTSSLEEE